MKKTQTSVFILIIILCAAFSSCDDIFGSKPPVTYTVTFVANGASGTVPAMQTVNADTVISLPDKGNLTYAGNIFVGWSENASGTGTIYSVGSSITVTGNMIFYAQWVDGSTPQYTVTFNANGATGGAAPASKTAYSGISITIPGQGTLVYSGKTFGGWNTKSNGGGTNYAAGAAYTVTENVTLYAKWQSEVQYTVTYHANGASGTAPKVQTVDPGTVITLPDVGSMVYVGRTFEGWNTQANGSGTNYLEGEAYAVNGNVTLYAKWNIEIKYTVTFYANGASGTAPAAQRVDPGTVITLPGMESMVYVGRTFEGWNTQSNGSGTSYVEGEAYTVNADTSFYARWLSVPVTPPGATLVEQLTYIRNNAADGDVYNIVVNNNVNMGPTAISSMGRRITVNIRSASSEAVKTIQLEGQGHLFYVDAGITLKLQDIELRGHSMNNRALIGVEQGTLILNSGAKITQNSSGTENPSSGASGTGGVFVNGGILEMNDGAEITGHQVGSYSSYGGGGITVTNYSNITIRGGLISENSSSFGGGGISIRGNSTATMSGGIISKNKFLGYVTDGGGGVYIENGSTFIKRATSGSSTSGIIYGTGGENANTARYGAQGIYRNFGSLKQRNSTLSYWDEITTLSDVGWE